MNLWLPPNHVISYWIPHGRYQTDEVIAIVNIIIHVSEVVSVNVVITVSCSIITESLELSLS